MKPINQRNYREAPWGYKHGYHRLIHDMNSSLRHKCNYILHFANGFSSQHFDNGIVKASGIAIDGKRNGYWKTRYNCFSHERHIEYLIGQKIGLEYTDRKKIYHL